MSVVLKIELVIEELFLSFFLKVSGVGLKVRPDIFDVEIADFEQFCFKLI